VSFRRLQIFRDALAVTLLKIAEVWVVGRKSNGLRYNWRCRMWWQERRNSHLRSLTASGSHVPGSDVPKFTSFYHTLCRFTPQQQLCLCFVAESLTLNPLTWKIRWALNNASGWQMGFNSAFEGLMCFTWWPRNMEVIHCAVSLASKPLPKRVLQKAS